LNAGKQVPQEIAEFLQQPTPATWVDAAVRDLPTLMIDHANCEKKAAATALSLLFRYADDARLCDRMSRLAREELRHYEQVTRLLRRRGIVHRSLSASRYAQALHEKLRSEEPGRRVDILIVGAYIEARSCERFALLVPELDEELARFYSGLLAAESRHFRHYLALAEQSAGHSIAARVAELGELEAGLATKPDSKLRFHSGPPERDGELLRNLSAAS